MEKQLPIEVCFNELEAWTGYSSTAGDTMQCL